MAKSPQSLRRTFDKPADVKLYDDAGGIFGDLIHPRLVVLELERESADDDALIGQIDDIAKSTAVVALHSQSFMPVNDTSKVERDQIPLEFNNACDRSLRVRWIDDKGQSRPSHTWTIKPQSNFIQYTKPGHLFLLSVLYGTEDENDLFSDDRREEVLCAYRPFKRLPSHTPYCVLIEQQQQEKDVGKHSFIIESMLMDEKKQDALIVAASELDPQAITTSQLRNQKALVTLKTILSNIRKHPKEEKFRKLRLSNHRIQRDILESRGGLYLLENVLGFRRNEVPISEAAEKDETQAKVEESENHSTFDHSVNHTCEEYLLLSEPDAASINLIDRAIDLIEQLIHRGDSQFVLELAPPVPWQKPLLATTGISKNNRSRWNTRGTRFVSAEERWRRAERVNQNRRSGRARRPERGNAPSSRGNWGR